MDSNDISLNQVYINISKQTNTMQQEQLVSEDWDEPSFRLLESQEDLINTNIEGSPSTVTPPIAEQTLNIAGSLEGQKAKTWEELFDLYKRHSNALGFSVKMTTAHYSKKDEKCLDRYFTCSCQGKYQPRKPKNETPPVQEDEIMLPSPIETSEMPKQPTKTRRHTIKRTGCLAMMKVKLLRKEDLYVVDRHDVEHNHDMVRPEWSHLKRSERSISDAKGKVIEQLEESGIRPVDSYSIFVKEAGGEENVGHTIKDHLNFVQRLRMEKMEMGDSNAVIDRLYEMLNDDPNAFFRLKHDEENRLSCIFWRDGMMRDDYELYGDVVIFDTTYRTNKYNLICAPIVGINNHWNTVMFGCAFMASETAEDFEWLLSTFKKSMGGKEPKTIFTDQDLAMSNAIPKVFKETRHRLCLWHIQQNAVSHFGKHKNDIDFKKQFSRCLRGCSDSTEFQTCWQSMIEKWDLGSNSWFERLYGLREKWSTAFSKDFFSAGILSSQRSESTNSAISFKANGQTSLLQFYDIFCEMVARWRRTEKRKEFSSASSVHDPMIKCGILTHAAEVYTLDIYKYFEDEVKTSYAAWCEVGSVVDENNTIFHVTHEDAIKRNPNKFRKVHFVRGDDGVRVDCSCKQFSEVGWLCYHALKVLNVTNNFRIPEPYISKRWSKDVKRHVWDKILRAGSTTSINNFDSLQWRHQIARKSYDLAMISQNNDATRGVVEECINRALQTVRELLPKNMDNNAQTLSDSNSMNEDSTASAPAILDPKRANTKGRKRKMKTKFERRRPLNINEFGSKTPNQHLI